MTHKPNRTNLPPAKSAGEYEREIAALRARVKAWEALGETIKHNVVLDEHHWADELCALSPKGEA